jgi:hypothetical protein
MWILWGEAAYSPHLLWTIDRDAGKTIISPPRIHNNSDLGYPMWERSPAPV